MQYRNFYSLSLFLGAQVTTSSTLKILYAASLELSKACSLTLKHSNIPSYCISRTIPSVIFNPASGLPRKISFFRLAINSAES